MKEGPIDLGFLYNMEGDIRKFKSVNHILRGVLTNLEQ